MRKILLYISFLLFSFFAGYTGKAQIGVLGTNLDFEATAPGSYTAANAVSGWTISSAQNTYSNPLACNITSQSWNSGSPEFSVMTTPVSGLPYIGTLPHSPLGGSRIVRLNDTLNSNNCTMIAQTFTIPYGSNVSGYELKVAYAGMWNGTAHPCCDRPTFGIRFRDCQGNLLSCPSRTYTAGGGCSPQSVGISWSSTGVDWTNWQVFSVDLGLALNTTSCVTLEVITNDCNCGLHYGSMFLDVACTPYWNGTQSSPNSNTSIVNVCPGQTTATITLPPASASYSWYAPCSYYYMCPSSGTAVAISSVSPGNIYTLTSTYGCPPVTRYYVIQTATLNSTVYGNYSTCTGGASGSATVFPNIAGISYSYNYSWVNSTNSVVSTNSFAPNLSAGLYSVTVNSPGFFSSCGVSTNTIMINSSPPPLQTHILPLCGGGNAYLNYNGNITGTNSANYQWYSGTVAIAGGQGGTSPTYTVLTPVNNSTYYVAYNSPQGCRDTVQMILQNSASGSITVSNVTPVCPNLSNGTATVSLTPSPYTAWLNYTSNFYAQNSSTSTPAYSYSTTISSNTVALTNLSGGGVYSLSVFDGACKYSSTFTMTSIVFDFSVTPTSTSVCSGNYISPQVAYPFVMYPNQYSYSWSPSTFIVANTNSPNVIIYPTVVSGSSATVIYSLTLTPLLNSCPPLTRTLSLTVSNPETPTLSVLPEYCFNAGQIDISSSASPTGGVFYFGSYSNNGLLNTTLANAGVNSYTYSNVMGACAASETGTYVINDIPVNLFGNNPMCTGQSQTLSVSGIHTLSVNSNTWNAALTNNSVAVVLSPASSSTYSVQAANFLNGCSVSTLISVNVFPIPQYYVAGNSTLCTTEETTTLSVTGFDVYAWNNVNIPANTPLPLSPTTNTVYFYTGTYADNCTLTDSVFLVVHSLPTVSVAGNFTLCEGETTTLNITGLNSYTWANSSAANTPMLASPNTNTVYSYTGNYADGICTYTNSVSVFVKQIPAISVAGTKTICAGETTTLNVLGLNSYVWNNLSVPANAAMTVSPNESTVYSFTGIYADDCSFSNSVLVNINPKPEMTVTGTTLICLGDTVWLTAAEGNADYIWNNTVSSRYFFDVPDSSTTYIVLGVDFLTSCSATAQIKVTVNKCVPPPLPFKIYPTLNKGNFIIETPTENTILVIDALGKIIFETRLQSGRHEINLGEIADGVYFVKSSNGTQKKIVKVE